MPNRPIYLNQQEGLDDKTVNRWTLLDIAAEQEKKTEKFLAKIKKDYGLKRFVTQIKPIVSKLNFSEKRKVFEWLIDQCI